ncbi:hypothetical protein KKA47_02525 [bacterium]|nr:hypothetical protein [bacterium]
MTIKKWVFAVIILCVAAASAAATIGAQKFIGYISGPGTIIILSDKRCTECAPERLETSLKGMFPEAVFKVVDYNDSKGKKLYKSEEMDLLPAVLLPKSVKNSEAYKKVERFAVDGKKYIKLKTGGQFDPTAEICDNSKDDNDDDLVDCNDPTCKSEWMCMEKKDKPQVDVFIMSHCPYGTQIEKGILPVWDALGDKVDLNIRFCDYAMHGKKEVDEQLKQHCIQKLDKNKYKKYLKCFLEDGKEDNKCTVKVGISKAQLDSCIKTEDKKFAVTKDYDDKSKWQGRFPPFNVDADLAKKYGVRGSPTIVINDAVANTGRSPNDLLAAICKGFKNPPAECKKELEKTAPSPGFGFKGGAGDKAAQASCGG